MSLAARVIPVMLCKGRQLVKGKNFINDRVVGHAAQSARIHAARGVDELMLLDVSATAEGRGPDLSLVEELTQDIFIPCTVGGGVRSVSQVRNLLRAGADKVLIGEEFRRRPEFVEEASDLFGSQAIVVSIDWPDQKIGDVMEAYLNGAGEILLNNKDRDGTMEGYDLDLIREASVAVNIPLIACGGCKSYEDMANAIKAGASAVAAGAFFQFEDATPRGAAEYLKAQGIEARL